MKAVALAFVSISISACVVGEDDPGTESQEVGTPFQAFTAGSYWNTPLDAHGNAPLDPNNAAYIQALKTNNCTAETNCGSAEVNHLRLTIGSAYGQPFYFASATDAVQTVTCGGNSVTIRVPAGVKPQTGTDGQLTVFDQSDNIVAGFHKVVMSGNKIASCDGLDRWHLNSNGLVNGAAGGTDPFNIGHRGVPAPVRGVRLADANAGVVPHRLECFVYASKTQFFWPMIGAESRNGTIPEGSIMRIKRSLDLTTLHLPAQALPIAKALQDYGCIIGDNSGSATMTKLEAYVTWSITKDALAPITWDSYEFVKGGYDPTTGTVH